MGREWDKERQKAQQEAANQRKRAEAAERRLAELEGNKGTGDTGGEEPRSENADDELLLDIQDAIRQVYENLTMLDSTLGGSMKALVAEIHEQNAEIREQNTGVAQLTVKLNQIYLQLISLTTAVRPT